MTPFREKLLDALQQGIQICARPYEELAARVSASEPQVLSEIARLKAEGLIRRFRGQINYRALGRVATLVTAKVPPDKLDTVIAAVNALPGVSHNYLRDHAFNLWFTLQAESPQRIEAVLSGLSRQLGIEFYSLPAARVFKLDVRFQSRPDSPEPEQPAPVYPPVRAARLSDAEKLALRFVQREFPLTSQPFKQAEGLEERACLDVVRTLIEKGVLKRIAAVVNHYKLGYLANGMFCAIVPPDQVEPVGLRLAAYKQVSHCYQRRPFAGWPYNLFAMIHAHTDDLLRTWTQDFAHTMKIENFVVLKTLRELKKEPVFIDFV